MNRTLVYLLHDMYVNMLTKEGEQKYKYIIHEGSSRSSKTASILQWIDEYCSHTRSCRSTVWRDTRTSLGSTVWTDYRRYFGHLRNFTQQATPIFFNNGSTFEPHGADFTNAHGLTQDIAWLNEPYKITKETFDAIDQRASLIIIDWNPKESHWIDNLKKHPRAIVIRSTFKDNPFCPDEQRIKIEGYEPWLPGSYEIDGLQLFYKGKPITEHYQPPPHPHNIKNETANLFNWMVYGLGLKSEKPNKIYHGWRVVTKEAFDAIDANVFYGLDFGSVSPTSLVACKYLDGVLYVHQLFHKPIEIDDNYTHVLGKLGISKDAIIVCDSAKPVIIASIRRAGWTRATPANKKAGSVEQGIKDIQSIRVSVTNTSKEIMSEYDDYEWEIDRYGLPTDKPIKSNDHAMDAIRYCFSFMKIYLKLRL